MAPRLWLPGLRGISRPAAAPAPAAAAAPVETKSWYDSWAGAPGVTTSWGTEGRADGWNLDRVVSEGYERIPWVFKSVETIARHQAKYPFAIGRGREPGEIDEVLDDHPLYRLLNGRANPLESGKDFRKRLSAQLLLSKRGVFVELTRSRRGTLTRLDLLPPDRVTPIPDDRGDYIRHFELQDRSGQLRILEPERVLWIRDPHPTDPFSGVTPLEAAGLSINLDYLARVYNVSFLRNDGRPGGIVGVDLKGVSEKQLDRIEERFAPGVDNAGRLSVIGMGQGGLTFIDPAGKPRDMAYSDLAQNAKDEILATFGVPESVLGNTSGRTYDNAEQDEFNYWTVTQSPHNDLVASAFSLDLDPAEGWQPFIDTSSVEALELPRRKKLQVLREEWSAGLISADEYREAAGRLRINNAQTRALWFSPQKAPVPTRPEDAAELGIGGGPQMPGSAPPPGPGAQQTNGRPPGPEQGAGGGSAAAAVEAARGTGGEDPAGGAAAAVAAARSQQGTAAPGPAAAAVESSRAAAGTTPVPGAAAAAVDQARADTDVNSGPGAAAAAVTAARESKAHPAAAGNPEPAGWQLQDEEVELLTQSVAGVLGPLLARQAEVTAARLRSPKLRKGTRYWEPGQYEVDTRLGDGPIETTKVVAADRWAEETVTALEPLVAFAVQAVATEAVAALAGTGAAAALTGAGLGLHAATLGALALAEASVRQFLADGAAALTAAQADPNLTLEQLVTRTRLLFTDQAAALVQNTARAVAQAALSGAAEFAAAACGHAVTRTWVTRGDDRVRPEHRQVDGVTLPVLEPFDVGDYPMRYPGDPIAPPSLTRNCRCRLLYRNESSTLA